MTKTTSTSLALLLTLAAAPAFGQDGATLSDKLKTDGRNAWLNQQCAPIVEAARKHVVKLSTLRGTHRGYGVVIEDGVVLTCDSILKGDDELRAVGPSGSWTATVMGRNAQNDIAALKLRGNAPAPIARGSSKALDLGQWVISAGTAEVPLAVGVVSAKDRPVEPAKHQQNMFAQMFSDGTNKGPARSRPNVIQHDGPVSAEEFGAPLLDAKGRLVGINVGAPYRGSSHAVGIDQIAAFLGQLTANAPAPRPWLGCKAGEVFEGLPRDVRCGLEVRDIQPGSPALTAGLKDGDIILAVDGERFSSIDTFGKAIMSRKPGDVVTLTILRGPTERQVKVTLGGK
jgi:putative serine protease PepD